MVRVIGATYPQLKRVAQIASGMDLDFNIPGDFQTGKYIFRE
jgi:hypothetical protein